MRSGRWDVFELLRYGEDHEHRGQAVDPHVQGEGHARCRRFGLIIERPENIAFEFLYTDGVVFPSDLLVVELKESRCTWTRRKSAKKPLEACFVQVQSRLV
jgi:hypothetical protein